MWGAQEEHDPPMITFWTRRMRARPGTSFRPAGLAVYEFVRLRVRYTVGLDTENSSSRSEIVYSRFGASSSTAIAVPIRLPLHDHQLEELHERYEFGHLVQD